MGSRARGFALLGAAAVCAGLAASSMNRYAGDVRRQVGPLVPVVTARADLARGIAITPAAARNLVVRRVPQRFAPPRALGSVSDALGYRLAIPLHAGDYLSDTALVEGRGTSPADRGGRVVEVAVAGAGSLAGALRPGVRVDILITTDQGGPARTYVALQDAELLAFAPAGGGNGSAEGKATATLRTSLRQAVLLTAAQNFARELRLVPRPAGDRRRLGAVDVPATGLGR